jgi:hypothetical protein
MQDCTPFGKYLYKMKMGRYIRIGCSFFVTAGFRMTPVVIFFI